MNDETIYKVARKRADDKIKFYKHLYSYITVNVILFVINVLFYRGEWWVQWVSFFWGIGILSHFIRVFLFKQEFVENYREKMIEKEVNNLRRQN